MEIRRNDPLEGPQIIGFSGAGFRLRLGMEERPAAGAILLDPAAIYDWEAPAVDALQAADLGELLQLRPLPEFLLLGTGSQMIQPPRPFVHALEAMGIGVEAMDSRAAARAWGVLRAEERWIIGALLPL